MNDIYFPPWNVCQLNTELCLQEKEEELSKMQGHIITAPDGWTENMAQVKINNVRASVNSETSE